MRLVHKRKYADDISVVIAANVRRFTVARCAKPTNGRVWQMRRIPRVLKSGTIYTFEAVEVKSIYYRGRNGLKICGGPEWVRLTLIYTVSIVCLMYGSSSIALSTRHLVEWSRI